MTRFRLVGVLGGTFDPVHYGHLRLAEELAEQLQLSEVRFIPAASPNLRDAPAASPAQRAEMVKRAIAGNPHFRLDLSEIERGGVTYTVDTLRGIGAGLPPDAALCLILGADAFSGLSGWSRWRELFDLAHIAVAARPGCGPVPPRDWPSELDGEWQRRFAADKAQLGSSRAGRIVLSSHTLLDISASAIRDRLAAGRSARYLLPDTVLDYIQMQHLYRQGGG